MKTASKTNTTNPHKWFFTCVKSIDGYNSGFAKDIREGIVFDHSGGKTTSLSELYEKYPALYWRMKKSLTEESSTVKVTDQRERFILNSMRSKLFYAFRDSGYSDFTYENSNGIFPHYENIKAFCLDKWGKEPKDMTKTELGKYINLVLKWK